MRTRGHADTRTCGHADTRTCGHAGQVENADMRTRNLLKLKKSITRIINNFSRDIESYQGCVITLTFSFSLFFVLVCSSFSVYFASFFSYRDKSRHGFIFSACKEARFFWQLFSAELMSYLHSESYYLQICHNYTIKTEII
jgi:hypothetical protein